MTEGPGGVGIRYGLLVASVTVLAVAGVEAEEACYTNSTPEATLNADERIFYLEYESCNRLAQPCPNEIWGYEESNGIPGLQRDDIQTSDVSECESQGIPIRGDDVVFPE